MALMDLKAFPGGDLVEEGLVSFENTAECAISADAKKAAQGAGFQAEAP